METYQIVLWAFAIVVLAIVVLYALRKGYNVTLRRKNTEAHFQKNATSVTQPHISVGKEMTMHGATSGDISGIKSETYGGTFSGPDTSVDVLKNADIKNTKVGDISGIKSES